MYLHIALIIALKALHHIVLLTCNFVVLMKMWYISSHCYNICVQSSENRKRKVMSAMAFVLGYTLHQKSKMHNDRRSQGLWKLNFRTCLIMRTLEKPSTSPLRRFGESALFHWRLLCQSFLVLSMKTEGFQINSILCQVNSKITTNWGRCCGVTL